MPAAEDSEYPGDPEALYAQGMAHYRRREWQEAKEYFLRLKAISPGRRDVDEMLIELGVYIGLQPLARRGRYQARHAQPEREQPELVSVPEEAVRRSTVRPGFPWLAVLVIAVALIGLALVVMIVEPSSRRRSEAETARNRGLAAMSNRPPDCSRAAEHFGTAVALAPDDPELRARYALAQTCQPPYVLPLTPSPEPTASPAPTQKTTPAPSVLPTATLSPRPAETPEPTATDTPRPTSPPTFTPTAVPPTRKPPTRVPTNTPAR